MDSEQNFIQGRNCEQGLLPFENPATPDEAFRGEPRITLAERSLEPAFLAVHYDRLADLHYSEYQLTGESTDLQASMVASSEAVAHGLESTATCPPGHSDATKWWALQGDRLSIRYERFGVSADLDDAIAAYEKAIKSTDSKSPLRPVLLLNQANALCMRYEADGSLQDINEAIEKAQETLAVDHKDTPTIQNDLSTMYLSKYEREGDLDGLELAVRLAQEAVERSREDDTRLTTRLLNLTSALMAQFEHNNSLAVIEKAISAATKAEARSGNRDAVGVVQPLSRLARAQYLKYSYTKERQDLHAAMRTAQGAISRIHTERRTGDDAETHNMLLDLLQRCRQEESTMECDQKGELPT